MARRLAWVCLVAAVGGTSAIAADLPAPVNPTQSAATPDADNDLALAAACLDRGEETAAAAHLSRHLATHPDRPFVRFSLAELFWRRERFAEARAEFERFLRDAPDVTATVGRRLQAHTRLVAVAEREADAYAEHLHRGVGLYLLAGQTPADAEALLCKAAGELTLAARERPAEARPELYLHLVWARLGQSQPAAIHLRQATALAAHADLTPAERRSLTVAGGGLQ